MRLEGKRAVVTGGASGIGQATARAFAREGARVVVADRDAARGEATASALRDSGAWAGFVEVDVTDEAAVRAMIAAADGLMGGIDVLVSNAGWSYTEDLLDIDAPAWDHELSLNLSSHFHAARATVPVMARGGGGSIVFVSSVNALWSIGEFGYSAAKAGLINLARNTAVTYGPRGIRSNVICPGTIETENGAAYWDQKAGSREKLLKWYPLGRLGRPEDVANLNLFLASDESSFINGSTLVIDGGLTAGSRLFGDL